MMIVLLHDYRYVWLVRLNNLAFGWFRLKF